jgi:hypothetical protein
MKKIVLLFLIGGFMKKMVFYLGLFLILSSCEQTYYTVPIANNSSKTVRFSYNGSIDELTTLSDKVYSVVAYTQPPVFLGVVPDGEVCSVNLKRNGEGYEFYNLSPISLHVVNTLPVGITIQSDNYIDNSSGSVQLSVNANDKDEAGYIYTNNPKFTVNAEGYSAQITYTITGNIMYVVVR